MFEDGEIEEDEIQGWAVSFANFAKGLDPNIDARAVYDMMYNYAKEAEDFSAEDFEKLGEQAALTSIDDNSEILH